MIEKNDVSAQNQVKKEHYVEIFSNSGKTKVLFIGNSITRHEPKPEIGWDYDWGMAASSKEKDYVHVAVKLIEEKIGKIDYCVANCGEWEMNYFDDKLLQEWKIARDFNADIVVIRLGENIWNARANFETYPLIPYFKKMVEYFTPNPTAKVIITGLFWSNDEIENDIKSVATDLQVTFVPLNDLGSSDENMALGKFWHSGVAIHPSDLGMAKIAERIVSVLK